MKKKCFKCGEVKPLSEFYCQSRMADGHLNKCIECTKKDARTNYSKDIEKSREKERERNNTRKRVDYRRLKAGERKEKDPEKYKLAKKAYNQKYRNRNREKARARDIVFYNISTGKLKNPCICQKCGSSGYIEAHHEDYLKPLEITWLCDTCHKDRHNELRRIARGSKT